MYERLVSPLAEYWNINLATCFEFSLRIFEDYVMTIEKLNYLKQLTAEIKHLRMLVNMIVNIFIEFFYA